MRVLVITSQVTYLPDNGFRFLETLLQKSDRHIAGVLFVQNKSLKIFWMIPWLLSCWCGNLAKILFQNFFGTMADKRKRLCESRGVPVLQTKDINTNEIFGWIRKNEIDLVINYRTREKYGPALLSAPRLGCINVHHGVLPKYRGLLCDLHALHEGRPAGFTLHAMTQKLDDGAIFKTHESSMPGEKNYPEYLSTTGPIEANIVSELLQTIHNLGELPVGTLNDPADHVYTKTPTRITLREMKRKGMIL